ncbi:MAG: ABC transporter permease [Planctomycetota bacterium]
MLLPWEYGVRNLARRPLRTALTLTALSTVVVLVLVVVGFIRGLEQTLKTSGDTSVVLVYSVSSKENIENSAIETRVPSLLGASIQSVFNRFDVVHVSPELYQGTRVESESNESGFGLVRGVTFRTPLVRRGVRLVAGTWPDDGEVMVGRLAAAKLGISDRQIAIGRTLRFEGQEWTIRGQFAADGAAYESEIWCHLADLQTAAKRQDISMAALLLAPGASPAEVALFCKERTDLELRSIRETEYYERLQKHYRPIRLLGWTIVMLVSAAGVFAGLNMMYSAVAGRVREIATLQAIGYRRRAILLSLIQEGVLLASAASLIASLVALVWIHGTAVRFTMGAFTLRIDSVAILIGGCVGTLLGILGAMPPALRALRSPVAVSLKAN